MKYTPKLNPIPMKYTQKLNHIQIKYTKLRIPHINEIYLNNKTPTKSVYILNK